MQSSILVPRFSSCSPEFLKPVFWHASDVVILGHYYCKLVFEKLVPLKLGQLTHIIAFSRLQNIFCVENCVSTIWAGSLCSVHSVLVSTIASQRPEFYSRWTQTANFSQPWHWVFITLSNIAHMSAYCLNNSSNRECPIRFLFSFVWPREGTPQCNIRFVDDKQVSWWCRHSSDAGAAIWAQISHRSCHLVAS